MRVHGLDPTATGKEVESISEHANEVTILYTAQKLVTSREELITFLQKNHVPEP